MKKKNKTAIIIICICVALTSAIITGIFFFILSNSKITPESLQKTITEAWSYEKPEEKVPVFITSIEPKSKFNVTDFADNGNGHYSVQVEVTAPDISQEIIDYQNSIDEIISVDEIDMQLKKFVEEAEIKTTQHTITVIYTDGEPKVKFTEAFVDAMYGYAYTYSINAIEKILVF